MLGSNLKMKICAKRINKYCAKNIIEYINIGNAIRNGYMCTNAYPYIWKSENWKGSASGKKPIKAKSELD